MIISFYCRKENFINKIDYTGDKYGHLTVKKMLYNYNNKNKTMCLCSCDCGKDNIIRDAYKISHLSTEMTSCGCQKRNIVSKSCGTDITGQTFNLLTIKQIFWTEYSEPMVLCDCRCGSKDILLRKHDVQSNHTKSCGCLLHTKTTKETCKNWTNFISDYGVVGIKPLYKDNNSRWVWEWKCPICNNHFSMLPAKIVNGHTTSCGCKIQSDGEKFIKKCLDEFNVQYIPQYSFKDCKYKYILKFDFAIIKNDKVFCLLEYDGLQHYEPVTFFGGEEKYKETIERDMVKNEYCKVNHIPLYRFKYDLDFKTIKDILSNIINP